MKGQGLVVPLTPTPKEHYRMLAQDFELKLTLKPAAVGKLEELPFPLDGDLIGVSQPDDEDQVYRVPFKGAYDNEEEAELLHWFLKLVSPDDGDAADHEVKRSDSESSQTQSSTLESRGSLVFPESFTKYQRAHWHHVADTCGLHSGSEGFGQERHLKITMEPDKAQAAPTANSKSSRSRSDASNWQRQKAKRIWDWCQTEGGSYLNYSQGEILQILTTTNVMPPDLAHLLAKRDMAKRVIDRLERKDSEGALTLLKKDRSLVWIQDEECGGYPLHVAAWQGLGSVVAWIIEQPTAMEQRDKQYKTPIQVARCRQHDDIVDMLLEAGAKDAGLPAGEQLNSSIFWSRELEDKQRSAEAAKGVSDFAPEAENETRKKEAEKHAEFEERAEELPEKVADKSKKRATASSSDSASEKEFARQGSFKRPAMLSAHDAGARDPAEEWNSPVASAPKVELWTDAGVAVSRLASPITTRRTEIAATEIVLDRPPMTLRKRQYHLQKKRNTEPKLPSFLPPDGDKDVRGESSGGMKVLATVLEAASWKREGLQNKCIEEEGFRPCSPLPSMAAKKPSQEGKSSVSPKSRSWYPAEEKYAAMAKPSLSPAAQEDLIGGGEQLSPSSATSSTASKLEGFPQQVPEALLRKEGGAPPGDAKQARPSEGRMCVMTDEKNVEFLEELLEAASLRPAPKKAQSFGASSGSASGKETATPREKATSRVSVGTSSKGSEAKTEQPAFPRPQEDLMETAPISGVQPLETPATSVRSLRGSESDSERTATQRLMETVLLASDGTEIDVTKELEEQRSLRCSYKAHALTVTVRLTSLQPETLQVLGEQAATTEQPTTAEMNTAAQQSSDAKEPVDADSVAHAMLSTTAALQATNDSLNGVIQLAKAALQSRLPATTAKQLNTTAQQNSNAQEGFREHIAQAMLSTAVALQATNDSLKEVIQLARATLQSGLPAVALPKECSSATTGSTGGEVLPPMNGRPE